VLHSTIHMPWQSVPSDALQSLYPYAHNILRINPQTRIIRAVIGLHQVITGERTSCLATKAQHAASTLSCQVAPTR
jgi:hypothetical protein